MLKRFVLITALACWAMVPAGARAADPVHDTTKAAGEATKSAAAAPHGASAALESDHAASGAHGGAAGHAKAPLLPDATSRETQLQALWVVIIFIALLVILYPTAWKNVLAGLKKREERIRKDIADAEAARARAEATLKEYNAQLASAESKVREILTTAQADAERLATSIRQQAQQESEEIKTRATRDIEAARDQAKAEIHTYAADLAVSVAEKILRRSLNADDQRDLVNQSLEQVQTIGR
jgi:F-type H+-transporting ATPase subunit b